MKIFNSIEQAGPFCHHGSCVTLGNFDGLHVGHRKILEVLKKGANKKKLPSLVYTFEPHPVKVLAPTIAPKLLNTHDQKIELLKTTGIDAVLFQKFDTAFAKVSPHDFFENYLIKHLKARLIIVGYDFTFGAKRSGTVEVLEKFCREKGIDIEIVQPFFEKNLLSSSSVIRQLVSEGKVKEASHLLTRPYFIEGKVVTGKTRGKTIGFATANLHSENELIPGLGVYATKSVVDKKTYDGITNIGINPTFNEKELKIETHLFGFKDEIYGKQMCLYFFDKIRDEKKFDSAEDLKNQIGKDILAAKKILKK